MFNIGDKLTEENYADGAIWCNENNAVINQHTWVIENIPEQVLTKEDVEAIRKRLYIVEVDPLTSQIQRLRDDEQTEEVKTKIADLIDKRKAIVVKIKTENPYPTEILNGGI